MKLSFPLHVTKWYFICAVMLIVMGLVSLFDHFIKIIKYVLYGEMLGFSCIYSFWNVKTRYLNCFVAIIFFIPSYHVKLPSYLIQNVVNVHLKNTKHSNKMSPGESTMWNLDCYRHCVFCTPLVFLSEK